jgi:hypothetical protein
LKGLILAISFAERRLASSMSKAFLQPQEIALRKTEEPAEAQIGVGRNPARAGPRWNECGLKARQEHAQAGSG